MFYEKAALKRSLILQKNCPDFRKKCLVWVHLCVKFSFKIKLKENLGEKNTKTFACGVLLLYLCMKRLLKCPYSKKPFLLWKILGCVPELLQHRLQHRCFHVNIAELLRTPILRNLYQRLFLSKVKTLWINDLFMIKWQALHLFILQQLEKAVWFNVFLKLTLTLIIPWPVWDSEMMLWC